MIDLSPFETWTRKTTHTLLLLLLLLVISAVISGPQAHAEETSYLAAVPPMGWNDWAHYECNFTADTILANARALVRTGLASQGYNTVTIDDCWMQKDRDTTGNLQVDPRRFPQGMKVVADTIHGLGLKFGIYEDAGYLTCGGFAGSGESKGGGTDHFLQDAKLFATWGVDYLKLDGCSVYVPSEGTQDSAYRKAYAAQAAALRESGRSIVFSESAPAYFQGSPGWYDVLTWVRKYGQLWREGSDIEVFNPQKPDASRFKSVLWNYAYNLPLGRYQKPGNWNDADFIIGGDPGMTLAETRSQLALWSMMSAPLILSSNLERLDQKAIAILSNNAVLAIDQDPLGQEANLVERSTTTDVLFKRLKDGDYAIAVSNRDTKPAQVELHPADFGFAANAGCKLDLQNLWTGTRQTVSIVHADVAAHDTQIWRAHVTRACGTPTRTGAIVLTVNQEGHDFGVAGYSRCLFSAGNVISCTGSPAERWTVLPDGSLHSGGRCLGIADGKPVMQPCSANAAQHWSYRLAGELMNSAHQCLTGAASGITLEPCGHNRPDQIWSLPN
jgi:alpha-galactosidase